MKETLVWHVCMLDTCNRKFICDDCRDHARGQHVCEDCRAKWREMKRQGKATVTVRSRRARRDAQISRIMRNMR